MVIGITTHIKLCAPAPRVGLMIALFPLPEVRHLLGRELDLNGRAEVSDQPAEGLRIGIVLAQRDVLGLANCSYLLLECVLAIGLASLLWQKIAAAGFRVFRIAKVEEQRTAVPGSFSTPWRIQLQ